MFSKGLRFLILVFVAIVFNYTYAQDVIIPSAISAESFSDGSLFKFNYIGSQTGAEPTVVMATAELYFDGQLVLTQNGTANTSGSSSGAMFIQDNERYYGGIFSKEMFHLGLFPEGSYQLCVKVVNQMTETQACESFYHQVKESPLHLRLTAPIDEAVLSTKYPLLVWSCSVFPSPTDHQTFEVSVFENNENRRGISSTSQGMPVLRRSALKESVLQYPLDAAGLEEGSAYTWQVTLNTGSYVLARSQVWSFELEPNELYDELPLTKGYLELENITSDELYYFLGNLSLKHAPSKAKSILRMELYDSSGKQLDLSSSTLEFTRSDPYEIYDLTAQSSVKHLKSYTIKLFELGKLVKEFDFIYVNPYVH